MIKIANAVFTGFFRTPKIFDVYRQLFSKKSGSGMRMMDLREATKTLNAYSTLLVSKSRLRDRLSNLKVSEAEDVVEKLIATLKVETRQAMVLAILVSENVAEHAEGMIIGFVDELPALMEAINRIQAAAAEARKATLAHEEKCQENNPTESPSARAIREFRARYRS